MKKFFLSVSLVALMVPATVLTAQPERKGHIGITVGPAFMTGELKDFFEPVGVGFSFIFGYLLSDHFGISSSLFGTQFTSKATSNTLGLSGLLVGPLLSTATGNEKVEFDFRPSLGFAQGSANINDQSATTKNVTFALGVGGSLRWNCWRRVSLSANLDYFYGKPKDDTAQRVEMDLSSFGFSFGVNYRF